MTQYIVPIIGLDIGTAKTVATVGWPHEKYGTEIIGAAMARTGGVERGVVQDSAAAAETVDEVLRKVSGYVRERSARRRSRQWQVAPIPALYVAVGGDHILARNTKGMLTLADKPVEITRKDMGRVVDAGESLAVSRERDIVHTLPQEFIVDGHTRSRDPRGMFGDRLAVQLHIISADSVIMKRLLRVVHQVGYDIEGVMYSGVATSNVVLTEEEKDRGTLLLELGAGTINLLWYRNAGLQYSSVLGHGGQDITRAIAQTLAIDVAQAEHLKMQFQAVTHAAAGDDKIIIKKQNGTYQSIDRSEVVQIITTELTALLDLVRQEVRRAGISLRDNNVVLAGGMTFMDGIIDAVEQSLRCPVRLATMRGFVSSQHGMSNLFYATGIGAVMHGISRRQHASREPAAGPRVVRYVAARLRQWYEDYF